MDIDDLKEHIEREEGRERHAYRDHLGYLTIGVGHMVDERKGGGLPDAIIDVLLDYDIAQAMADLDRGAPWWRDLKPGQRFALTAMSFQMGWPALSGFRNMFAALKDGDGASARNHALDSKWAKHDTPERARRVVAMMED
ncbi:MAG: lysozyme [Alphaproteobacteria bacterium]|nr:lysozyme [Alphaproteobacteria bacterium]